MVNNAELAKRPSKIVCGVAFLLKASLATIAVGLAIVAFAQTTTLELLATVQTSEASELRGAVVNDVRYSPQLDIYLLCVAGGTGADYGYVDTNRDGYADVVRQYGAAMVSANQWEQAGPRVLAPLRNQATLRAQSAIAQTIAVHVAVSNGMADEWDLSNDQVNQILQSDERIRAQASEVLRGSGPSGTRLVSLPDGEGVCLVVRYDAPLRLTNLPAPARISAPVGAPPARDEPGRRYSVPGSGTAGDF